MNDRQMTISDLKKKITTFSKRRGWDKKENIKDLVMALTVEASELMEIFQWIHSDNTDTIKHDEKKYEHVKEEVADVFWYLIRICKHFDIDLTEAVEDKAIKNAIKYPVE